MDLEVWEDQGLLDLLILGYVVSGVSKKIIEFLEVAIHSVAYTRHLYPSSSFAKKQKYGTPIRLCTHPGVSGYIKNCLKGIEELLNLGEIESVHLILVQADSEPLERFVFDFSSSNTSIQEILLKESIELFQMFCLKLAASHSHLDPHLGKSFLIETTTTNSSWQSTLLNSGDTKFLWCEAERSVEKRDPLAAKISPAESFHTTFVAVHNIIYKTNTTSHVQTDSI